MGKIRSFFRRRIGLRRRSHQDRDLTTVTSPTSFNASPTSPNAVSTVTFSSEEELERVFKKFDANGDGRISRSEMGEIFQSLGHPVAEEELDRMMREVDADGDGFISMEEFADLMAADDVDQASQEEELRHAFAVYDMDRNGAISPEELFRVMRSIGEVSSVAQCRKMVEGVDIDGDGMVSFEEFKVMMAKNGGRIGLPRNS